MHLSDGAWIPVVAYSLFLIAAGLGKLDSWSAWKTTVDRLLPEHPRLAVSLRFAIPLTELGFGVLTLLAPTLGLWACGTLLVVLAAAVLWFAPGHAGEPCNCFGVLMPSEIGRHLAVRNLVLGGGAFASGILVSKADSATPSALQVLGAALLALLLVVALEFRRFRGLSTHEIGRL